ncbi:MAG: succinic semialdehyde dehydrogenase [Gaiellales bacterium]
MEATTTSPDAAKMIEVTNPATGALVERVRATAPSDIPAAAAAARAAQAAWATRSWRERADVIARFHDLILERQELVLDTIQTESGKARRDALIELTTVAGTARYYLAHGRQHLAEDRRRAAIPLITGARSAWRPHPLVGLITPWNFPFLLGVADALPALLAGCAVLTKPSEETPRSTLLARDLLVEAGLDPALFQPLIGSGAELGAPLIEEVDYLGFTGSAAVGRIVAHGAAERLIPFSLELGGKNPMIVLPGADLEDAVHGLITGAFANAGQTCIAVERIYVHEQIWDEFVSAARARVRDIKLGWSQDFETEMGSVTSAEHAEKVRAHINDATSRGATVLAGGSEPIEGLPATFIRPTLLTDTDPSMLVHATETFGPVVRLERVASEEDAILRANDSELGLNASIWAGSRKDGRRIARRLEVGAANVNSTLLIYHSFDVPMGGIRGSGLGRRHGAEGIRRFCRQLSVVESFERNGGYEMLLRGMRTARRSRLLLRVIRLWRRIPGIR